MKRKPELHDLSDDHHIGLVLARRCRQALREGAASTPEAVWAEVREAFARELEPHFGIEDRLLVPALEAIGEVVLAQRIRDDHTALRALCADREAGPDELLRFGEVLHAHIRFEERQVFDGTQDRLSTRALAAIARACREQRSASGGACSPQPSPAR